MIQIHPKELRASTYRNPAGVAGKLGNFLPHDKTYIGTGRSRGSKLDPLIFNEFVKANPKIAADYQLVHDGYDSIVKKHYPETSPISLVGKYDFYDQTRKAFAVVMTGDTRIYANLILAKGVTTW